MISIGVSLTLWACSKALRLWEGIRWEMHAECTMWLSKMAPGERPMQGVQGCKHREGAVRRTWGSFLDSSGEKKGFLKF